MKFSATSMDTYQWTLTNGHSSGEVLVAGEVYVCFLGYCQADDLSTSPLDLSHGVRKKRACLSWVVVFCVLKLSALGGWYRLITVGFCTRRLWWCW